MTEAFRVGFISIGLAMVVGGGIGYLMLWIEKIRAK